MPEPSFYLELTGLQLDDKQAVFVNAIATGREIECHDGQCHYFIGRGRDNGWSFYCEETGEEQWFPTGELLWENAVIGSHKLSERIDTFVIDCML